MLWAIKNIFCGLKTSTSFLAVFHSKMPIFFLLREREKLEIGFDGGSQLFRSYSSETKLQFLICVAKVVDVASVRVDNWQIYVMDFETSKSINKKPYYFKFITVSQCSMIFLTNKAIFLEIWFVSFFVICSQIFGEIQCRENELFLQVRALKSRNHLWRSEKACITSEILSLIPKMWTLKNPPCEGT